MRCLPLLARLALGALFLSGSVALAQTADDTPRAAAPVSEASDPTAADPEVYDGPRQIRLEDLKPCGPTVKVLELCYSPNLGPDGNALPPQGGDALFRRYSGASRETVFRIVCPDGADSQRADPNSCVDPAGNPVDGATVAKASGKEFGGLLLAPEPAANSDAPLPEVKTDGQFLDNPDAPPGAIGTFTRGRLSKGAVLDMAVFMGLESNPDLRSKKIRDGDEIGSRVSSVEVGQEFFGCIKIVGLDSSFSATNTIRNWNGSNWSEPQITQVTNVHPGGWTCLGQIPNRSKGHLVSEIIVLIKDSESNFIGTAGAMYYRGA